MITINLKKIDYFLNESEAIIFFRDSSNIFTLSNSSYLVFKELSKYNLTDLGSCLKMAKELSLSNSIFFSIIERLIALDIAQSDLNKSEYKQFIKAENNEKVNEEIKNAELKDMLYEPTAMASSCGWSNDMGLDWGGAPCFDSGGY